MPSLLARINETFSRSRAVAVRDDETRYSVDQWMSDYQQSFNYNGTQYVFGGGSYSRMAFGDAVAEISSTLPAYAAAMRAAPPAFAAQMVRALILSQARFTFRGRAMSKSPKRTFGTRALSLLEQPGPGLTTGKMLSRMEWHAGLAGNAFAYRQAGKRPGDSPRLRVLRPDWTAVLWGSNAEPEDAPFALDNELLGYVYWNGGYGCNKPWTILPNECAHWAPIPDVENAGLGMSWVTPAIRDMQGDRAATDHKLMFFKRGAVPGLVIKGIQGANGQPLQREQFNDLVDMMEARHAGVGNAYSTLYLTAGADASVIGADLKQIDFASVQGKGETRVSFLSRVPAALLGISEGLAGSSLNAGNFGMARRIFADSWVYPSLQDLAGSLATIVDVPSDAELWTDVSDMPILREDSKDQAEIVQTQAAAIASLINSGYTPKSCVIAIQTGDLSQLEHTGLFSVQLQPPGNGQVPGASGVPVGPDGTTPTGPAAGAGAPPVDPSLVETVPPEDAAARAAARTRRDIARAKRELDNRDKATRSTAPVEPIPAATGLTGQEWRDVARALTARSPSPAPAPPVAVEASTPTEAPVLSGQEWTDAVRAVADVAPTDRETDATDEVRSGQPAVADLEPAVEEHGDLIGDAKRAVHDEAVQAYRTQSAHYDELRVHSEALRILGEIAVGNEGLPESDDDLDEDSLALLTALDELSDGDASGDGDDERAKAFNAAAHPRNPKGAAGGGRFRSLVDRVKDALNAHVEGKGKGDPFDGFDREQLRKVAKARGLDLKRGEDRDSIAKKLLGHLSEDKPGAKTEPQAAKPKAPAKPRAKSTPRQPKAADPEPGAIHSAPMFTMPADVDREAVAALRARFTIADPSTHSGYRFAREVNDPDPQLRKLIDRVGPVVAARLAWEGDNDARMRMLVQILRPEDPSIGEYDDLPPVTDDEIRQMREAAGVRLARDFAGKKVAVRTTPATLDRILADGRFKTQFETARSGGGYDPDRRARFEEMAFGLARDSDPTRRPIYGYVAMEGTDHVKQYDTLDTYGDVRIVLKDHVRDRTTASVGDTLDQQVLPSPIQAPTWESFNGSAHRASQSMEFDYQRASWLYAEAQIHGGVSADDIEEVLFTSAPSAATAAAMKERGIPWRVLESAA